MHIISEVEEEDILREAFLYIYKHVPMKTFLQIGYELFTNGNANLKDWLGLTIAHIGSKEFVSLMEYAVKSEEDFDLRNCLNDVLTELKK
jgi:hypothetical protein